MNYLIRTGLILLSIILASCGNPEPHEHFNQSDYDADLMSEYNLLLDDFRFEFENHPDTLAYAIALMDEFIARDPDFSPAYVSKHSYQCRLGDMDGAFITIREFINREPGQINSLSILGMMHENIGQADSAGYYIDLAIDRFSSRCRAKQCTDEDQVNLTFLKLYRGDMSEDEALDDIRRLTNENEFEYYTPILKDFDREELLANICRKTVTKAVLQE